MASSTAATATTIRVDGTRTPSPPGTVYESSAAPVVVSMNNLNEVDVPSPVPASVSSTTSSEPSHHHHNAYSVPNPFQTAAGGGWGGHVHAAGAPAPPGSYPPQPQHAPPPHHAGHHYHGGTIPMVVSAPAPGPHPSYHHYEYPPPPPPPPSASHHAWARENSCPNFSIGTTEPKSPGSAGSKQQSKAAAGRRRYSTSSTSKAAAAKAASSGGSDKEGGVGDSVNSRRQKRLERNRESARLSRRRRKQYLEILEERVTQLSTELDQGRRAHASQAVTVTLHKRREILEAPESSMAPEEKMRLVEMGLGRTSPEMMLLTTFKCQQLKSFALPAQSKFILWLTLQNDQYFRGGRAASERLSAARIGERMLNSGNDHVPPAQSMWPLFCNEIGLSYDQEERVRAFQRTLLQLEDSWVQRHQARAADLAMGAVHDSTQAMTLRLGQRERSMLQILSPAQKVKFLSWAEAKREKLKTVMDAKVKRHVADHTKKSAFLDERFKADKGQHVAANLYIINHQLQKLMQAMPRAAPLVTGATLKKLSRRPSFESLGRCPMDKDDKDGSEGSLSREQSFASSGTLKRSASVLSMDADRPQLLQISPDDAEETCKPAVEKVLGYVKEIIPPNPPVQYSGPQPHPPAASPVPQQQQRQSPFEFRIPSPAHVTSAPYHPSPYPPQYAQQAPHVVHHYQHQPPPHPMSHPPVPMAIASSQPGGEQQPEGANQHPGHKKSSSFIPPYLNVVPEEMFPNDGTADDLLMSMVDEDWAIGEGIDMDTGM